MTENGCLLLLLTSTEVAYLERMNPSLRRILGFERAPSSVSGGKRAFLIPLEELAALQSALIDRVTQVGFDENYDLTDEGRLIEEIIDRIGISSTK